MSDVSEESSASESEASDGEERNLPEGAPRISSGALLELEGGEEEEFRYVVSVKCSCSSDISCAGKRSAS